MAFDGTEGAMINLQDGADLTANYRNRNSGAIQGAFYGREKLEELLGQSGCMGIRIYYGLNSSDEPELVLVGADADENDILDNILDSGVKCPPNCGERNDLNS